MGIRYATLFFDSILLELVQLDLINSHLDEKKCSTVIKTQGLI